MAMDGGWILVVHLIEPCVRCATDGDGSEEADTPYGVRDGAGWRVRSIR